MSLPSQDPGGPPLEPSAIAAHYSRFRVGERVLLTGHSHQAWPDVGFEAQQRAWADAAELVDGKWERAEAEAQRVREGFARLVGDRAEDIALGQNTHELVTRWLSALPLRARPRLVTTDGEFHSLRRQLDRLAEESIDVVRVPARPVDTLAERLATSLDDSTAAALVSSVLFDTSEIVPDLAAVADACIRVGASLLVDAYHHLNVVPFDVRALGLESAFVTGGGYKYCQLGEGNCFLRVPPDARLRPVLTGWFAEFAALDDAAPQLDGSRAPRVQYGRGATAFAGATYDPTSHYRGAAVFAFHHDQQLVPSRLRRLNKHQTRLLRQSFEALDLDPRIARLESIADHRRGGFVAIRTPFAQKAALGLRGRLVWVDARGDLLRVGPAPYVTDGQLETGIARLGEWLRLGREGG